MSLTPFSEVGAVCQKTFNRVSQLSHFGWGAMVVFGAACFSSDRFYIALAALWIMYAAVKEFLLDSVDEIPNERGSDLEDFAFQALGAVVAVLALVILGGR